MQIFQSNILVFPAGKKFGIYCICSICYTCWAVNINLSDLIYVSQTFSLPLQKNLLRQRQIRACSSNCHHDEKTTSPAQKCPSHSPFSMLLFVLWKIYFVTNCSCTKQHWNMERTKKSRQWGCECLISVNLAQLSQQFCLQL